MTLQLKSSAFDQGGTIPAKFSCDGKDLSPALEWNGAPAGTKSFALIMDDPDAPMGTWDHWILFNLPATTSKLEEGITTLPTGTKVGKNSWKKNTYGGPCPPDREHRYFFKLFALDTTLALSEGAGKHDVGAAIRGHIIEQCELMGRYNRPGNKK